MVIDTVSLWVDIRLSTESIDARSEERKTATETRY